MKFSSLASILVGLTIVAAVATSCTPEELNPTPSITSTAPRAEAGVDPLAEHVPVDGDEFVSLEWTLAPGVDADDPVVDVARRTTALFMLTELSPGWNDLAVAEQANGALTDESELSLSPENLAERVSRDKVALEYPLRLLMRPPEIDGDTAVALLCVDASAAAPGDLASSPAPGTGSTILEVVLTASDGYWRTTSWDLNTENWTHEDYQVCAEF